MFFVGATGQLLTLFLTVILPLMMLVSGQQKIEVKSSLIKSEIRQGEHKMLVYDFQPANLPTGLASENQEYPKVFPVQENSVAPEKGEIKLWKTFYLHNSGNKAPPSHL